MDDLMNWQPFWIPQAVKDYAEKEAGSYNRYAGWIQWVGEDLVLRIFAFKRRKNRPTDLREVIRKTTQETIYRDMYLPGMTGWQVCYEPRKRTSQNWYGYQYYDINPEDFGKWEHADKIGIGYEILNKAELYKKDKYKYCGYSDEINIDIMEYLRRYEEHPGVEFFGKMNLKPYKNLIKKAEKDKQFINYLRTHDIEGYNSKTILYAYKHHKELEEAADIINEQYAALSFCKEIRKVKEHKLDKVKIYRYCKKRHIGNWTYWDYLRACEELGLDLNDTKNLYPHDFTRMHDLRTTQYAAKRAREDRAKSQALNKQFKAKNKEYKNLEYEAGAFCVILPNGIRDLQKEGKQLDHCVGKMGYDKKVADGKSIIAFIRRTNDKDTPYVTVEYGIKEKRILQCYGAHDSDPGKRVHNFANKWEERTKKILKSQEERA